MLHLAGVFHCPGGTFFLFTAFTVHGKTTKAPANFESRGFCDDLFRNESERETHGGVNLYLSRNLVAINGKSIGGHGAIYIKKEELEAGS